MSKLLCNTHYSDWVLITVIVMGGGTSFERGSTGEVPMVTGLTT